MFREVFIGFLSYGWAQTAGVVKWNNNFLRRTPSKQIKLILKSQEGLDADELRGGAANISGIYLMATGTRIKRITRCARKRFEHCNY